MKFHWTRAMCVAAVAAVLPLAGAGAATAQSPYNAKAIFFGAKYHLTGPDDIAIVGPHIFVGFQNGVGSQGEPSTTGVTNSTLVEMDVHGSVEHMVNIRGKIDGLGSDAANNRVIVTVNEDGNSRLSTVDVHGKLVKYTYSPAVLPHHGGTDAVSVFDGKIYLSASCGGCQNAASAGTAPPAHSPAVYQVTLNGTTATLTSTAINVDSPAVTTNPGSSAQATPLKITDADSNTVVPSSAPRFGGDFMLDSQGDKLAIFASSMAPSAPLKVLDLKTAIDDTTFATQSSGVLVVTDSTANTVEVVTGPFHAGEAFSAVTPCNDNAAPATCPAPGWPANYLAALNLSNGSLTPLNNTGATAWAKGLAFMPSSSSSSSQSAGVTFLEVGGGIVLVLILVTGGALLVRSRRQAA